MKHLMLFEQFLLEKNPMEVTSKDDMRINDIIRKSGGDSAKAEALARTMASRITDYYKAIRRASAAQSAGRSDLAQIFKDRSRQLNEGINDEEQLEFVVKKRFNFDALLDALEEIGAHYLDGEPWGDSRNEMLITIGVEPSKKEELEKMLPKYVKIVKKLNEEAIKVGSTFVKKEGKSQMNGKKGMFDAVEGDTLKITRVFDDGKEFRGIVSSKYGNDQVLVSASQLRSWERTK